MSRWEERLSAPTVAAPSDSKHRLLPRPHVRHQAPPWAVVRAWSPTRVGEAQASRPLPSVRSRRSSSSSMRASVV